MKKNALLLGLSTAFASSLCCIIPILALITGATGISSFEWMEPLRPYTIGFTFIILGFVWFRQLKPRPLDTCGCELPKKTFMHTKGFLSIATMAAVLLLTFPSYSHLFYQNQPSNQQLNRAQQTAYITVEGMTCEGCEHHLKQEVSKLKGIASVHVSYAKKKAVIKYDLKKTSWADIKKAIDGTGYKAINPKIR